MRRGPGARGRGGVVQGAGAGHLCLRECLIEARLCLAARGRLVPEPGEEEEQRLGKGPARLVAGLCLTMHRRDPP